MANRVGKEKELNIYIHSHTRTFVCVCACEIKSGKNPASSFGWYSNNDSTVATASLALNKINPFLSVSVSVCLSVSLSIDLFFNDIKKTAYLF